LLPRERPDGTVSLANVHVASFLDDQTTWPTTLYLRGFVYDRLENDQVPVRERLRWLRRHGHGYTPQIYEQLAAAYRRDVRDEAARRYSSPSNGTAAEFSTRSDNCGTGCCT
jgi:hypothetical protein